MKVKELTPKIEHFLAALEEHAQLWESTLDEADSDCPSANPSKLREQMGRLARQLGMLRPYIDQFEFPTTMRFGEAEWDIYDSAVSNGVSIRKGRSLEAVFTQLQQALGRLDSLNADDEIAAHTRPIQTQPQAALQPVTINLLGPQSRVNVQSSDHSTNVEQSVTSRTPKGYGSDPGKVGSPASTPNPEPNVRFLGITSPMVDKVFDVPRRLTSFHASEDGEFESALACFRNEAIYGKPGVRIRNARAHLKYFDREGSEIGGGVSYAFWLNHKTAVVDLLPGTMKECIILLLRDRDKFGIPTKTRDKYRGVPITGEKIFWDLSEPPSFVEISVLGPDDQLLFPPLSLELDQTAKQLMYRLKDNQPSKSE
jgi:hypothetical protein